MSKIPPIILQKTTMIIHTSPTILVEEMVEEMVDETVGMVEFDYDSCKVVELKALCEERNLENYKRLRKPELIELLKNN